MPDDAGEAEQYLYCTMTIGEQLCFAAEQGWTMWKILYSGICLAYGATGPNVFSITSGIERLFMERISESAQARRVPEMSNDLGRLDDLNQLSRYICGIGRSRRDPEGAERSEINKDILFKTQIFDLCCISGSFSCFPERCQRYDQPAP